MLNHIYKIKDKKLEIKFCLINLIWKGKINCENSIIPCSAVCSGEALPEDLLSGFFEAFPPGITLLNYYGSTETTGDVTYEIYRSLDDVKGKTVVIRHAL